MESALHHAEEGLVDDFGADLHAGAAADALLLVVDDVLVADVHGGDRLGALVGVRVDAVRGRMLLQQAVVLAGAAALDAAVGFAGDLFLRERRISDRYADGRQRGH